VSFSYEQSSPFACHEGILVSGGIATHILT